MSAFLVSPEHINAILNFAVRTGVSISNNKGWIRVDRDNAEEVGQILFDENARSVAYRYRETPDNLKIAFNPTPRSHTPVEILKLLNCYDYQACETDDYEQSQAAHIVRQVRQAAIRNLDGYEEAPWTI